MDYVGYGLAILSSKPDGGRIGFNKFLVLLEAKLGVVKGKRSVRRMNGQGKARDCDVCDYPRSAHRWDTPARLFLQYVPRRSPYWFLSVPLANGFETVFTRIIHSAHYRHLHFRQYLEFNY